MNIKNLDMENTGLIIAIVLLSFIISPYKVVDTFKGTHLPKWAKKMKSSDTWMMNGKEVLGKARIVKWLLLTIMRLALLIIAFCDSLLKTVFSSSKTLLPSSVKK